jgi:hypothetical protein
MKNKVDTVTECAEISRSSAVDLLKGKRAKIAREMTTKLKEYDRMIRLAEETDAENVMREVYDLLD